MHDIEVLNYDGERFYLGVRKGLTSSIIKRTINKLYAAMDKITKAHPKLTRIQLVRRAIRDVNKKGNIRIKLTKKLFG